MKLLKQEIEEVDSEDDDDAILSNKYTDGDEFFLDRENEKKYED